MPTTRRMFFAIYEMMQMYQSGHNWKIKYFDALKKYESIVYPWWLDLINVKYFYGITGQFINKDDERVETENLDWEM